MVARTRSQLSNIPKTACIIGGGFAGLAAAVFLDALGVKVTLLEKKPVLGGRAYAFKDRKTGTWVDNGQHLIIGAYRETLRLIENIGATRHLSFQKETAIPLISDRQKTFTWKIPNLPPPLNAAIALARLKALSLKDKLSFIRIGGQLKKVRKESTAVIEDVTVDEWLIQMGQSAQARKNFWEILTLATLNDDPSVAQARMVAVVLEKGFLGTAQDSKLVIAKSNLNEVLAKPAQAYLELRGHSVRTSASVKKINILDRRVQSVELDSGETLKADFYLNATTFSALLRLIPPGFIESEPYFGSLRQLKAAPIISINFWFDRDILPHSFVGVAEKKVHWYFNRNRIQSEDSPPYHIMGVISGAYALVEESRDAILEIALKELKALFPEAKNAKLLHALVNKEREATLSPRVGCDALRPTQQSPFDNFYVIGDWTRTGLPATIESAVVSARLAIDCIDRKKN